MVPFFRAVRAEERGVTKRPLSLGGLSPPPSVAKQPQGSLGHEATHVLLVGLPPFVGLGQISYPVCRPIRMKFGGKGLWAKLHRMALLFFDLATRGLSYKVQKVKKWAFWPFWGILRQCRAHKGEQGPHKACASILGSAWAHA